MSRFTAASIIEKYISFFEKRDHKRIKNASLVPENDPTTLFTSSGMQPLVPYLLGEKHPQGDKLVNVQNSFRAQDIEEVGDNRHTTFFRMLGNWSLGSYFKKEQLPWFFSFLTDKKEGLGLEPKKLYVSVFKGYKDVPYDKESEKIWTDLFRSVNLDPTERIFAYDAEKNWWSRAGVPDNMPIGEPGGPDSEVFFEFDIEHNPKFGKKCHINCDCGKYLEIGNSVFMQFKKTEKGFEELPQKNVDFGGGLERLLAAVDNTPDVFKTNLFYPIIQTLEEHTGKKYSSNAVRMRITTDHLIAGVMITSSDITPSNTEQGYILRRLLRRSFDNYYELGGKTLEPIIEKIVQQYQETDSSLKEKYENIKLTILEEEQTYLSAIFRAKKFVTKKYTANENVQSKTREGDELKGTTTISAEDAFTLYATHGLSPSQIASLGYSFDRKEFSEKMKQHQALSRKGADKKFKGGLADESEKTVQGHTATHLLHQSLRDLLGETVKQSGSNITGERVRFDFTFERKLTDEELRQIEQSVNEKIKEDLPVYFKILPKKEAENIGALSFFHEKYGSEVKVYFIGPEDNPKDAYSKEFCGGPHVQRTGEIIAFKILKEKSASKGVRRIYAQVGS